MRRARSCAGEIGRLCHTGTNGHSRGRLCYTGNGNGPQVMDLQAVQEWRARKDSDLQPLGSKPSTLSS